MPPSLPSSARGAAPTTWKKLLNPERLRDRSYKPPTQQLDLPARSRPHRLLRPFQRLANKTQVQPLYEHGHVQHRLIHSIEVDSVRRSLAIRIGDWLVEEGHLPDDLRRQSTKFEGNAQSSHILTHLEMYLNEGGVRLF
ncbi:hypothetical protein [Sagittula sp. SSi028]|uniref:hypothetical protein n=1 Tax=Sagittula sp. SSi028 TaxID=3400636 RepID=UPI003AF55D1F